MSSKSILKLDVGGQLFKTNIQTLCKYPDSMLCAMFSHTDSGMTPMPKTEKGHFFLDADPIYFRVVLNWLRLGKVTLELKRHLKGTMALAEYFGLDKLTEELKMIDKKNKLPSPSVRTVARSYETVDETIEDNVRHLEEELEKKQGPHPSHYSLHITCEIILKHLRNAIKLSGGYAIDKLAAKRVLDRFSSLSPVTTSAMQVKHNSTIRYYINAIKECY